MKKQTLKAGAFGLASLLFSTASFSWDHTVASQGPNGDQWAVITSGTATPPFNFPYAECGIGAHQSPVAINLTAATLSFNPVTDAIDINPPSSLERRSNLLAFDYGHNLSSGTAPDNFEFFNSGHVAEVSFGTGYMGKMLVGNDSFPLVQFHFHTPSEHVLVTDTSPAPIQYAGELHFVHQRADGKLAVLAVLLDDTYDQANPALQTVLNNMPKTANTTCPSSTNPTGCPAILNPRALLPNTTRIYSYAGSLTTPPCSEGVNWYVLAEPLPVARSQIQGLQNLYANSNRFAQNSNSRAIAIQRNR